ncbi:MAG: aminoglycoside phosphotransferase family protein [Alphaproteobacteria bacterium]
MMAAREAAIDRFLGAAGWGTAARRPLAGDASFRRYLRLERDGGRAVLMDAPPPMEDVRPFVRIAGLLRSLDLSAPEVLAIDAEHGLLLLEDLGDDTYTRVLAAGGDETALYALAVDLLVALQARIRPEALQALAAYDLARMLDEATVMVDWFLPSATGHAPPPGLREDYLARWADVLAAAPLGPPTLVLRDYHVDNLMWLPARGGVAACGLLDFQDAVAGPRAYDLVSLLEDARRDLDPALVSAMRVRYLDRAGARDAGAFDHAYAVLGAQRNCRIVGVFARLDRRDGKPHYLRHLPRLWRLIAHDLRHPALAPIAEWLDRHVPPAARGTP